MQASATSTTSRRAELILHEVESLPTLSAVATRLMKVTSSDDADLREIIRLIESDPVLTAKVLSLCRRADLGLGARVTTVERAVILLGLETLQSIVRGAAGFEGAPKAAAGNGGGAAGGAGGKPQSGGAAGAGGLIAANADGSVDMAFDRVGFWRHCIGVACCAEFIAQRHRELGVSPSEAFVAGLLHDLGKLALDLVLPQAYRRIIGLSDHRQGNIADVERQVIGLDHHTAGKRLAERWDLPPMLLEAIWLHGQRYDAMPEGPHRKLVGVVGVADTICRGLHLGWSGNHVQVEPLEELVRPLGLDVSRIEQGMPALLETVSQRCADLGLSDEPTERMVLDALGAANRQLSKLSGAMSRRARTADTQARVLDAVAAFLSRVRPEQGTVETLTCIAASAAQVLGPGAYAVVCDTGEEGASEGGEFDAPWLVLTFDVDGVRKTCDVFSPPRSTFPSRPGVSAERKLTAASVHAAPEAAAIFQHAGAAALNLLPAPSGEDAGGPAGPSGAGRGGTGGDGGMGGMAGMGGDVRAALLIHDRDEVLRSLGRKLVGALIGAWGSSLAAAIREESVGRLGEQLADANRRLSQTQRELSQAQSMARLAELTAGAAHEFNTPLAVISGRAELLLAAVTETKQKVAAKALVQATKTLSSLVTRLHMVASPPEPQPGATSVADLCNDAVKRAAQRSPRTNAQGAPIPIRVTIAEHIGLARLDRELTTQALVEVIVNALESEPRDFIDVRIQTDPVDDRLLVQVTDTGRGMSAHALEHAMDPFFSEKPAGRQPGLGLALAQRLISKQGATLVIDSTPGDGTIVTIAFQNWKWVEGAAGKAA